MVTPKWTNFDNKNLVCSHCGAFNPNPEFIPLMDRVQFLRTWAGIPFKVTSAYRCEFHSIEAAKVAKGRKPGYHTKAAIDFQVPMVQTHRILKKAYSMGFTGIGTNLKGPHNKRFIHLDDRPIITELDARSFSY